MEIKDFKQFLANGGEIRHIDGSIVTEAHQWADGKWAFRYSDTVSGPSGWSVSEIEDSHTFRAPRERFKTWHHLMSDGFITGSTFEDGNIGYTNIGYTICEKQDDGTWKVIETTLKPNT